MNPSASIPLPTLIAYVLWLAVAAFLAVCWQGWFTGDLGQAQFGGFTAAALVGPATVAHLRLYAARICALVRVTGGLECPPTPDAPVSLVQ